MARRSRPAGPGFLSAPVAVLSLTLAVGAVPDHERASATAIDNVYWSAAMLLVFGLARMLGDGGRLCLPGRPLGRA